MIGKFFKGLWACVQWLRAAVSMGLFLLVLIFVAATVNQLQQQVSVPENAVLWLEPSGAVVEQYSFNDPLVKLLNPDQVASETSLHDIVQALEMAANDDRIKVVVLDPDEISSIGHSAINSIHRAIAKVQATGKPVLAYSRGMEQHQYLFSAIADELVVHPMGHVTISGYGAYRDYMKSALDKLAIDVNVFRVGDYKSALEPFIRDNMSNEAKAANQQLLDGLWHHYTHRVATYRELAPADIDHYANQYAQLLQRHQGSAAEAALDEGLVDSIATDEEFWTTLETMYPELKTDTSPAVGVQAYLASALSIKPQQQTNAVAVVTVEGAIIDGEAPPGAAGGDTIAAMLWEAKNRDDVKAVVLRVNSGGGSAFASEIIRERVLQLQREGKPVVVSMGNVAASGGYWIAANADEIWASPTTITGSIGIFAAIPTAQRALGKLGISNDGVGTNTMAEGFNINRQLHPNIAATVQASIEHGYERFIDIVSEGRKLERANTLAAAGGRVWTGVDAKNLGLVDYLGEIEDAIGAAAKRAKLGDTPPVIYLQDPRWAQFSLLQRFTNVFAPAAAKGSVDSLIKQWLSQLVPVWLRYPDPSNIYLRCVECAIVE